MEISFIIIVTISILVTALLNYIFKKKRYIKYIPVIILIPFMIYYFITMHSISNESFESLGKFVMGLLLLIAILSSFIYSITVDIFHNRNKRNKLK
jgi:drug/metabolite transporter (DMT)-like permease